MNTYKSGVRLSTLADELFESPPTTALGLIDAYLCIKTIIYLRCVDQRSGQGAERLKNGAYTISM
jgi:hypothetical protein